MKRMIRGNNGRHSIRGIVVTLTLEREREREKKCIPEARMKCSVCTFVNASWHGCAPTIMYCLASGSGYREPVSAQVFGVLQCYSAPLLFSINFFLFRSHIDTHILYFSLLLFLHFSVLLRDIYLRSVFKTGTSAPQRGKRVRLSLIKIREDSSWLLY